ncbi:uncharacterized protein LOC112049599 [Bicyclus anynana]|uniref:Uncharacterized protein LOC112049599 n=1 Tax=Bicyclus anynana TaxID=110368 RepID=A0ABM3M1P3_BICAN|nr:uncharacterized protein LOC112049599 [Bicyclus anynana]
MFAPCVLLLFILGSINADEAPLRCDFINNTLCGWSNDENVRHDWKFNGYDSKGMYTALLQQTSRLISPIYDHGLVENGCFSLEYGFYTGDTVLRVYQVPVSLGVTGLFTTTEEQKRKYIIHESKHVIGFGTHHLYPVAMFHPGYAENFQIVIEVSSEMGVISIDKVEIFRGRECTEAANTIDNPPPGSTQIYYVNRNKDLQTTTTEPSSTTTEPSSTTTTSPPTTTTQSATTAATVPVTTVSPTAVPPPSSAPPPITMVFPAMGQLYGLNDSLSRETNQNFHGWTRYPRRKWENGLDGSLVVFLTYDWAILLSPPYDNVLTESGCFSSSLNIKSYESFTLRIYQIPVNVTYQQLLQNKERMKDYILFQKSGLLYIDTHIDPVIKLKEFDHDFQIIIEVTSVSDLVRLAVENVAILQGSDCTAAHMSANYPSPDSLSREANQSFHGWKRYPQKSWETGSINGSLKALLVNELAILLSPPYDRVLNDSGCFSSSLNIKSYESFTLRIYQIPVNEIYPQLLRNKERIKDYILFQISGIEFIDTHIDPVIILKKFDHDFQIIIEATSVSDLVSLTVDNVAILQGSDCTAAQMVADTPRPDAFEEYYIYTTTTTTPPTTATTAQPRKGVKDFVKDNHVNQTTTTASSEITTDRPVSIQASTEITTDLPPSSKASSDITTDRPVSIQDSTEITTDLPPSSKASSDITTDRPVSIQDSSATSTSSPITTDLLVESIEHLPSKSSRTTPTLMICFLFVCCFILFEIRNLLK